MRRGEAGMRRGETASGGHKSKRGGTMNVVPTLAHIDISSICLLNIQVQKTHSLGVCQLPDVRVERLIRSYILPISKFNPLA